MTNIVSHAVRQAPSIHVHHVTWARPFVWLSLGWRDLRLHPVASCSHGLVIAALWFLLLAVGGTHPYVIAALVPGFMLLGPVLASGLCELSRRQDTGQALTFEGSVEGISAKSESLMRFSALLAALTVIWIVVSAVLLHRILGRPEPSLGEIQYSGFLAAWSARDLLDYVAIGGLLALVVLSLSVVAVPLMLDREVGAIEAMHTSLRVTLANVPAMLVWSALLVALVATGFATLLLGLVMVVPVMGHATWHAYREMVSPAVANVHLREVT